MRRRYFFAKEREGRPNAARMNRPAFKALPGKFSSAQWRAGNAARNAAAARSAAVAARRSAALVAGRGRLRRRQVLPEKKFFDTALSFTVDATGEVPATGQITLIPQGDTESTRDGRKANIESVQIRANCVLAPASSTTAATIMQLYLVLDTQANGAAAAATDVFTSTNFATAMLNLNNSGRFRILKHWVVPFKAGAGVSGAYNAVVKQIEYYQKCDIDVDWSGTTGAITEIRSNNLFLMAGTEGQSDDIITVTGNARLRFRG